jgi:ethanolamine utilization protein EutM
MEESESFGFVETMGLVAAVEAADAMVKAARVRVKTVVNADAGLISVICEGDLAACSAAVDAGKAAAERAGGFVGTNLIPRPYTETSRLISEHIHPLFGARPAEEKTPPRKEPDVKHTRKKRHKSKTHG